MPSWCRMTWYCSDAGRKCSPCSRDMGCPRSIPVSPGPLAARAQQAMPVVGFVHTGSAKAVIPHVAAFLQGLKETGFANGRDITEFRWAEGNYERLPALMQELVRRPVSVLATIGGLVTARAAKASTSTIPIVFVTADDPVETGLVQ